jgi:hypothetical protein
MKTLSVIYKSVKGQKEIKVRDVEHLNQLTEGFDETGFLDCRLQGSMSFASFHIIREDVYNTLMNTPQKTDKIWGVFKNNEPQFIIKVAV